MPIPYESLGLSTNTQDPLKLAFDNACRSLLEMKEQVEKTKERLGSSSYIYQRQQLWFDCFIEMQDLATKEINALRDAYRLAELNSKAKDIVIASLESSIPAFRLMELYG